MNVGQKVFVSYSKLPDENAEFVRELVRILRANGFDPWLDEEQISGGADFNAEIRRAIATAHHGLFVICQRWLKRPYTQMEVSLFAKHDPETHGRVAILRDGVDSSEVSAHLLQLHLIRWRPDDPQPDARLWEVFAALTQQAPGPREEWAKKGRQLREKAGPAPDAQIREQAPPPPVKSPSPVKPPPVKVKEKTPPPPPVSRTAEEWVACGEPPVTALACGESVILLTDGGQCFRAEPDGRVDRLAPLDGWAAAAVETGGRLVVGQYRGMLARIHGGEWEYKSLGAAALTTAAGPFGVVVGFANGAVTWYSTDNDRPTTARFPTAVVDLCPTDDGAGVVVLGADGSLGRLAWEDGGEFVTINLPPTLDRPVGLFPLPDTSKVGVFSADVVGTLGSTADRVRAGTATFPDGIRTVVLIGRTGGYYAVLTDAGRLFHLEGSLATAHQVLLPTDPADVIGLHSGGPGGLLAWTAGGTLFGVSRDRTVRRLADGDVVLACPVDPPGGVLVVRWTPERGLRVQMVRPDQGR